MILKSKRDCYHRELVGQLRNMGASVQDLSRVGYGCPDLLIGFHCSNLLMELKRPDGKLNPKQIRWQEIWKGQTVAVYSLKQAIDYLKNCSF